MSVLRRLWQTRRGNDGLTNRQRRRLARKWNRGAGKAPSGATIRARYERVGNDGLTQRERRMLADDYRANEGRKPTAAEVREWERQARGENR